VKKDHLKHVGNKGIRDAIDKIPPRLILCGHIHENQKIITHNGTLIVKPSAAKDKCYAIIEINKKISAKLYTMD
jgi:Icc-related predicted phosphoesterase